MTLQGIYPTWLGEAGATEVPVPYAVDGITVELEGPAEVVVEGDPAVVLEDALSAELDDDLTVDLEGDIEVDLECP